MFFLIGFIILTKIFYTWSSTAGSALFYNRFSRMDCWTEEDIAKLRARKIFEQLIQSSVTPERVNSKYIRNTLRYYRQALSSVEKDEDQQTSMILKQTLADTIGAHLRSEVLPTVRFAYYAGYVPYVNVRELHDFYDNIKMNLNTQGVGWRRPDRIPKWSNLTVAKIVIGNGKYYNPCGCLVIKRDSSSCLHLPAPKLDDEREPSGVALPLNTDGLVSLTSPVSENVLLKYYTTASRCILNCSPAECRHADFVNFNNEMWHWMKRHVAPHLGDEKLYAAYGGVLRIAAAVQSYGKGLSRRNLFDVQSARTSSWHPWKSLTDTYIYVNTDWTPHLYVGVVMLAAVSIFLMQMCFNYVAGDEDACSCKGGPRNSVSKDVAYADIESNIPAMLPSHQSVLYSEQTKYRKPNQQSLGSVKTQKVYDLNENTEKLMTIGSGESSDGSSYVYKDETGHASDVSRTKRSASPPKIETSISQVQLSNCRTNRTRSVTSVARFISDSQASESNSSDSSSSGRSFSSTTSKSKRRKSTNSRNLAWARRVLSAHTLRGKSTSGTELDCTSYTTPPT